MARPEHENPWTTLGRRTVYENPWIRVVEDQVLNPQGGAGIYGVVQFQNRAVGVIPVDEEDHTWLVGQYRYTLNRYEWEIPEGGAPLGESLEDAARRELLEEVGLEAAHLELLIDGIQTSNSVTNEEGYIFVATGLTFRGADPEPTEELRVRRVPLSEAFAMAERGEIRDAISVAGLLRLKVARMETGSGGEVGWHPRRPDIPVWPQT
jgi:8-oxo-dGTP pyrophosphatase MutT (NUDIX family)